MGKGGQWCQRGWGRRGAAAASAVLCSRGKRADGQAWHWQPRGRLQHRVPIARAGALPSAHGIPRLLWPRAPDLFLHVPPLFPDSQCQLLAKSCWSPWKGFRGHRTDHPLSLVLQMNRPIQVKPADSEGRGGRSPIPRLPGTGRGAQGHPGGDGGHGGIVGVAAGGLVCREIWERSCLCWWHPNLSAEQMPCSLSLSGQLGGTS